MSHVSDRRADGTAETGVYRLRPRWFGGCVLETQVHRHDGSVAWERVTLPLIIMKPITVEVDRAIARARALRPTS